MGIRKSERPPGMMNWQDRLLKEKSLLAVYRKARKVASAPVNSRVAWGVFIVLLLALAVNAWFGMPVASYGSLIVGIREVAEAGFAFTTALLGFLIVSFAAFVGIAKSQILILLAKLSHKKEGVSRLQFILFNFLLVLIHFLAFLALCLFVKVMLYSGGPLSGVLRWASEVCRIGTVIGASCMFAVMTAWLVFLLMLLKSFIWNLYQALLVTILTEAELNESGNGAIWHTSI